MSPTFKFEMQYFAIASYDQKVFVRFTNQKILGN